MKKTISLILAAALLLCLFPMAMANPVQEGVLDGYFYAAGNHTNMLRAYADTDYLYDLSGKPVLNIQGMHVAPFMTVVILTSMTSNQCGLYDVSGKELLPVVYDEIELHDEWAIAYRLVDAPDQNSSDFDFLCRAADGSWTLRRIIDKADVINCSTGAIVVTLGRSDLLAWNAWNGYVNLQDRSGVVRTYDSSFSLISEEMEHVCSFACVRTELKSEYDYDLEKEAVADQSGKLLTEAKYEYVNPFYGAAYAEVDDENDLTGLVDLSGREVIPTLYTGFVEAEPSLQTTGGAVSETIYETAGVFCAMMEEGVALINGSTGAVTEIPCDPYSAEFYGDLLIIRGFDENEFYTIDGSKLSFPEGVWVDWVPTARGTFLEVEADDQVTVMDAAGTALLTVNGYVDITGDAHILAYDKEANQTTVYTLD